MQFEAVRGIRLDQLPRIKARLELIAERLSLDWETGNWLPYFAPITLDTTQCRGRGLHVSPTGSGGRKRWPLAVMEHL